MLKRITLVTIVAVLVALPIALSAGKAAANNVATLCYVGTGQFRFGIIIEVDYDEATRLVKKRRAFRNYLAVKQTFQGYQVCYPLRGNPL